MSKWIFERMIEPRDVKVEDGGQAKIIEFSRDDAIGGTDGSGFFLRAQSWDEDKRHVDFDQMVGTRVRITVETF